MKLKVGVVGLGYWGPNYIRNFSAHPKSEVLWGCDLLNSNINKLKHTNPSIKFTKNFNDMLSDPNVNCIAIATPPKTHFKLAKESLLAGKHVFISKPLTTSSRDTLKLISLAKKKKLLLFCDLTFLFYPPITKIKKLIEKNVIGEPIYFDSIRTNLGLIQKDVNVIWDLAIHDLSILDYCLGLKPISVSATASKHVNSKTDEMAHLTIAYPNNFIAHIHVSWISPLKMRTILFGGSRKMILFDDISPDEKVKIYDKGVILQEEMERAVFNPVYRSGDILIPRVGNEEALFREIDYFIKEFSNSKLNYNNAEKNYTIIKVLEASDKSLMLKRLVKI